jgi:hypothetical protein
MLHACNVTLKELNNNIQLMFLLDNTTITPTSIKKVSELE